MSISKYRVFLRDLEYRLVDEITDYLSLTAIRRFNDVGTWTMELPAEHKLVPLITRRSGIVIKRDNVTIFSGPIGTELKKTALTFAMSGPDDSILLTEPARPTPTQASGPYPDDYHILGGPGFPASTVLREIVNTNIGPLAPVGCRIDKLALGTDPLVGGAVTFRGNFQTLLAAMQEIALTPVAGGLRFEIVQSDTLVNMVELRTGVPVVRNEAIFSTPLNTASDYEDIWEFPEANYWVVMGGDGFGASTRTIVEDGDVAAIDEVGRRITGVYVAQGVTDPGELNQKLAELMAGSTSLHKTTIQPFEVDTLEFGDAWDFGDIVTVVVDGVATQQVIREVQLEFTSDAGVVVTPMVGDPNADNDDRGARQIRVVKDRMSNIELNWRVPDTSITRAMLTPPLYPPIGEVKWLAGPGVPAGHLAANGQAVSRATYALLYSAIGTAWGAGDGSTTFNVPDLRNRSPIGSGSTYSLGQLVGATTASISDHQHTGAPHTHPGSHGHGLSSHVHSGAAHTHPGSHSHGLSTHDHNFDHSHNVSITHNHGGITGGPSSSTARGTTAPTLNVATDFHWHDISSDTSSKTTGSPDHLDTSQGLRISDNSAFTSTDADTNAPAASAANTGVPSPNSSESDSNVFAASYSGSSGLAGATTSSIVHPSAGLLPVIYAGV